MIEAIVAWSIRKRWLVLGIALAIAAAGALALLRLPVDVIPDLSENQVIVFADWAGHAPREIEDQVTWPLSSKLSGLSGLKAVRASSEFNFAMISLIFDEREDYQAARQRVLERLQAGNIALPSGVAPYLAPDATALGQIYWYTVEGGSKDLSELRALQDYVIKPQLSAVEGVAEVASVGGTVREYQIAVDPERLKSFAVSLGEVVSAASRGGGATGGGVVQLGGADYLVRGVTWAGNASDIGLIPIVTRARGAVLLRDVATVRLGPAPRRALLEKNGAEVSGGVVLMRHGENPLAVTERIRARVAELQAGLPDGVRIVPFYDRSRLVGEALGTLRRTLLEEIAVCVLVVLLVLGHLRSSLVVVLTLPVAVLASFLLMWLFKIPANIMSLAGVAIAIGVLADSAMVMMENAYTRLHEQSKDGVVGGDTREVTLRACLKVARPLFFSVLITIVSFLPVLALGGMEGKLFRPLALTKLFALAAVALLTITLVPALVPLLVRGRLRREEQSFLVRGVAAVYRPTLHFLFDKPRWVMVSLAAVAVIGLLVAPRLGSEFMPALDEGAILEMPVSAPGITLQQAGRDILARDAILRSLPEVELVVGKVGRAETATDPAPVEMIETMITLLPRDQWPKRALPRSTFEAIARRKLGAGATEADQEALANQFDSAMRELSKRVPKVDLEAEASRLLGDASRPYLSRKTKAELVRELDGMVQLPGWANIWTQPIINRVDMLATGIRTMVGVKITGGDPGTIQAVAAEVAKVLREVPGAADVFADQAVGQPHLELKLDRARAAAAGVNPGEVEDAIEVALGGKIVGSAIDGRRRVPLRVRYALDFRESREDIGRILVGDKPGVPLSQVTQISIASGPGMIRSENSSLVSYVQLNVRGRDLGSFVADAQAAVASRVRLPPATFIEWGGQFEHQLSARRTLSIVLPVVIALIFLILYLTWSDAGDALLLMLAVPGALVGGLVLQWLCGYPFSVAVWVGYIACFGLATETGIIMLVYLREAIEARGGLDKIASLDELRQAVLAGALQRLRPKLLTEGVIVLSLLPMLWATGTGAEILRPMAAPVLGGILVADEIIDLSIPVLFYWLRRKRWLALTVLGRDRAVDGLAVC